MSTSVNSAILRIICRPVNGEPQTRSYRATRVTPKFEGGENIVLLDIEVDRTLARSLPDGLHMEPMLDGSIKINSAQPGSTPDTWENYEPAIFGLLRIHITQQAPDIWFTQHELVIETNYA